MKFPCYLIFICTLSLSCICWAEKGEIALTIDDLPFVGESKNFHLNMIIETLKAEEVPATGFVIAQEVTPANMNMLKKFRDSGLSVGNHTFSHANLNKMNAKQYIQEIDEADKILEPFLTTPKYFRYPYLVMGNGEKKNDVMHFLSAHDYEIAPITIDSKTSSSISCLCLYLKKSAVIFLIFLKPCYLNFIWEQTKKADEQHQAQPKTEAHILLIHANLLNAYVLPDIINLYKEKGYTFITLEEALDMPTKSHKTKQNDLETLGFDWD